MDKRYITLFKNIKETSQPFHRVVEVALDRIKNGKSKDLIEKIRSLKDKNEINELKKQLPAICFSGVFSKRNDASIQEHSGLICLDFDEFSNDKELLKFKKDICKDEYVYSCFISPSGRGLKVLIKIPNEIDSHVFFFEALNDHFNSTHFDLTCKNLSRVCYESYDPKIYINEESRLWVEKLEKITPVEVKTSDVSIPITDESKIIEILTNWWEKKYPMQEGQRNNNLYILAAAFNDFGITKSLAEFVAKKYESSSFSAREIKQTIDSAYLQIGNFGSKSYEDTQKISEIKSKIIQGKTKDSIIAELKDNYEEEKIKQVVNKISLENSNADFWTRSSKGVIKIFHLKFKNFLEEAGFYKYNPQGSSSYVFVRVKNNLIDNTTEKEIKDYVLNYLMEVNDVDVYNYFAENTKYFREEFLTLLSSVDALFMEDTKNTSYLYYTNCAVKITPKNVEAIDYIDLGGFVWKDHVIPRKFAFCDYDDCDYQKFISNVSASNEERISSMESTIGYLMHGYKNLSYCPAVILYDEILSNDPEGGTGKGIFMNALQHMKKLVVIDGKAFHFERSFPYQLVSADTQLLCFDDVRKNFDFERLFSVITEGLTLEKKNKDAIKIPFNKSPKVSITTNYAIKGDGNSFERRKWELELAQYYNSNFTPFDDFGKLLFGDWDKSEWCQFDNYMIYCLQLYMNQGLIKSKFVNLKIKKLAQKTCHEFIEWVGLIDGNIPNEDFENGIKVYKQDLYFDFISDNPDFAPKAKRTVSRTEFYRWLKSYAIYKSGVNPEEGKDGGKGRWIQIVSKHSKEETKKIIFEEPLIEEKIIDNEIFGSADSIIEPPF
tara:strand:+ start:126 stop:2621 length:2496 start_codon:yes stop_codon:yes gene_type:complete